MGRFEKLEIGRIGLIKETEDDRIVQIGLTEEQSEMLQIFVAVMSKEKALIQLPEEFDLIVKNK